MTGGTARYLRATPAGPGSDGESTFVELGRGALPPKIAARCISARTSAGASRRGIGSVA